MIHALKKDWPFYLWAMFFSLTYGLTIVDTAFVSRVPQSYPAEQKKVQVSRPQILTAGLSSAKKYVYYENKITASINDPSQKLEMFFTNLPQGLKLGGCETKTENEQTTISCSLNGVPQKSGDYQLGILVKSTVNPETAVKSTVSLIVE